MLNNFIKQPNIWSCLPTAFGNALAVSDFISKVGHDGSQIINDRLDPHCRQGFHPEEMIRTCLKHYDKFIWTSEAYPCFDVEVPLPLSEFYNNIYQFNRGVITGNYLGKDHAFTLFNNCKTVHDPSNGSTFDTAYLITVIKPYFFYGVI